MPVEIYIDQRKTIACLERMYFKKWTRTPGEVIQNRIDIGGVCLVARNQTEETEKRKERRWIYQWRAVVWPHTTTMQGSQKISNSAGITLKAHIQCESYNNIKIHLYHGRSNEIMENVAYVIWRSSHQGEVSRQFRRSYIQAIYAMKYMSRGGIVNMTWQDEATVFPRAGT